MAAKNYILAKVSSIKGKKIQFEFDLAPKKCLKVGIWISMNWQDINSFLITKRGLQKGLKPF